MKTDEKVALGVGIAAAVTGLGVLAYNAIKSHEVTIKGITVSPANLNLPVGESQNLIAIANYSNGSSQDVTESAIWVSGNPNIAAIQNPGVVVGVSPGTGNIAANYLGVVGYCLISVA